MCSVGSVAVLVAVLCRDPFVMCHTLFVMCHTGTHQSACSGVGTLLIQIECQAKVGKFHLASRTEQDVARLQVAVHNPLCRQRA